MIVQAKKTNPIIPKCRKMLSNIMAKVPWLDCLWFLCSRKADQFSYIDLLILLAKPFDFTKNCAGLRIYFIRCS